MNILHWEQSSIWIWSLLSRSWIIVLWQLTILNGWPEIDPSGLVNVMPVLSGEMDGYKGGKRASRALRC
eukprot:scaffold1752_cov267-Chaetoceros_neogracile.AAC.5